MAPCRIQFSRMANRRNPIVIPILQLWHRYREQRLRSHDTLPPPRVPSLSPQSNLSRHTLREAKGTLRHHVVPSGLPHFQQLPAFLPTRSSRCPPTSLNRRWPWWLCRLLEQPHWTQDRSFLVCLLPSPSLNAPASPRSRTHKQTPTLTSPQGTSNEMGHGPCRRIRLLPPCRIPLLHPELCAHVHRSHLDPLVLRHPA
jgi:hypothetical protein